MWFVLLAIALAVVAVGGLYVRRRLLQALATVGVGPVGLRVASLLVPYLLFAFPILTFLFIAISLALGSESFSFAASGPVNWLIAYPFWISMLTMLQALPYFLLFDVANFLARRRLALARRNQWRAVASMLVVGFFLFYTPARIIFDRDALNVKHYQVGDSETRPLRLVFMGDLQRDAHTDDERTEEVIALVNQENPDLILVGGDWINTGKDYIQVAARAGGKLRAPMGVLSVRGDHEHFAYRDQERSAREISEALAEQGVAVIDNQVRRFEHEGKTIGVGFLSYNYIVRSSDAEIKHLIAELAEVDYSILVTHQFDEHLAGFAKDKVDLVLAAHTHGGQVNPAVGLVHVPLARVETRFVEGRYALGSRTTVIVTAGIGFSIAPFRYASPASIEVIELRL